jgi:hypothetical protein
VLTKFSILSVGQKNKQPTGFKRLFYGGESWQMWIVRISTEIAKDALYMAHIRKEMTGKINACQAVIGKAVPITQAKVTRKKYQKKLGQTLIYNLVIL